MSVWPVVKGVRLRATKVDSCGLPIEGPKNRVVTDGFISYQISPNMRDADDLEQTNAEGRVCVSDRTPPERKWYDLELELCGVNTCLIKMFTGWPSIVNHAGDPVGFSDKKKVESDYGVAIEIWTGGKAEDDCPTPESDDIFEKSGTGKSYGYFLTFGTEFTLGDIEIKAEVANFTLSGISLAGVQWGRGPYNVVPIDDDNTAGRLLEPLNSDQHLYVLRTPIAPPDATEGNECVELDISNTFTGDDYYFGGPDDESAVDVAPDQPDDEDGNSP